MAQQLEVNSENLYQGSLQRIKEIIQLYDPLILISSLAFYGLTTAVGDQGIQTKDSDYEIYQPHIEILQGLILQSSIDDLRELPFGPNIVQEIRDSLTNLMSAHSFREISQMTENIDPQEGEIKLLQQWIRSNTKMVRNWGYFSQVKSISQEIYEHFDDSLLEVYGFKASSVIKLFKTLLNEIESANQNRFQDISKLYRIKNKTRFIVKYHEMINQSEEQAQEFIQNLDIKAIPFKNLFFMALSHYDLRLPDNYKFTPDNLAIKLGLSNAEVTGILDKFSYKIGDLESYETEHIFLSNPIWLRPIIKLDSGNYFCALPQVFFSFILPSLDGLFENIDKAKLSKRKADYLENKISEIIKSRFPDSNTISGIKWKIGNTQYETDLLTFIDSHVLIVEAKSGRVNETSRRGAPSRLRKNIEDLIISPNIQSKRLKERLEELISNPEINDDLRDQIPVDLSNIHQIIRVSVSLEDFSSIQANMAHWGKIGWLPDDFEPCPTITLADFETLFDFLEHPVQIIHYLQRRQELEENLNYTGDELDLMGLYIETLFNLGEYEAEENLIISEMSFPLDRYYNSKDASIELPKPKPKISPLFSKIFNQLENRLTPRWTEIGVILNRFSPYDQQKLTKMIRKIEGNVRKYWKEEGHKNTAIIIPSKSSKHALCYVIFNNHNESKRDNYIQNAAALAFENEYVTRCLVIAKNMDKNDLAYHFIGLMSPSSER
ncbi:MAG: hypothetical protein AAF572_09970 [Cyanobacteria bacterium P01_B01_bin.77]